MKITKWHVLTFIVLVAVVVALVVTNTPPSPKETKLEDLREEQPVYYTSSAAKLDRFKLSPGVYVAVGEFEVPHGDMIANNSDPGCVVDEQTQLEKNLKAGLEALSKTDKHIGWLKEFGRCQSISSKEASTSGCNDRWLYLAANFTVF